MSWMQDPTATRHRSGRLVPLTVLLLILFGGFASGQAIVLDKGVNPIPLYYTEEPGESGRQVGVLRYEVELLNGTPLDDQGYTFSFTDQEEARLRVSVTVDITRPNSKKNRDIRVVFSREAFGSMGRKSWKIDPRSGNPFDAVLAHGESRTFTFRYRKEGAVDFNLPFVVASQFASSEDWRLPPVGSLRNHLLSRQIKVTDLLSEEDRLWRASRGDFAGVATYLRAYPRGKYEDEAGRLFTDWLDGDFQHLVLDGQSNGTVRAFISRYTPFEDFNNVSIRLEAARARLSGNTSARSTAPPPAPAPVRRRTRSRRPVTPPVAEEEVAAGEPAARIISQDNGVQTIQLYNFSQPAYYDIYGGLLDIDDSKMRSDHVIRIRQIKQGSVDFLVVERGNDDRYATVQLHNLMEVHLTYDDVLGRYDLSLDGGVMPYELYLQPLEGQRYDWGMDGIEDNTVNIPVYDLQRAGLEGKYLAQVTSAGAKRAVTLGDVVIDVPPASGNYTWIYPLLVALGIGLFALLLLFLLNRIGRRKKYIRNRQRVQV